MSDGIQRLRGKFLSDTAWNYVAFALMAGTGAALNFFIAGVMGVKALGVFNQVYAVYIVTGQLAAMGIHDSAQKHTAQHAADASERAIVGGTSLQTAFLVGGGAALALWFTSGLLGRLADSGAVGTGIAYVAPGIALFALNKVLMGILNGERRMRAFAAAQSIRVLTILGFCVAAGLLGAPAEVLALGFTAAEAVLLPVLLLVTRPRLRFSGDDGTLARMWRRRHVRFGMSALPNGFLSESYVRIDVLMLALFVSDEAVGVYSFAAMFVEGLFQVPVVIRTVANPVLVPLLRDGRLAEMARFARRVAGLSLAVFAAAAGLVLVVLPFLAPLFPAGLVDGAHELLFPLFGGLLIYSAFIPFDYVLLQAGMPVRQSLLMTVNVLCNVALNLVLIPRFGLTGAAAATAISFCLSAATLNGAAALWLGFRRGLLVAPKPDRPPT